MEWMELILTRDENLCQRLIRNTFTKKMLICQILILAAVYSFFLLSFFHPLEAMSLCLDYFLVQTQN